jgi:hypothetical protein
MMVRNAALAVCGSALFLAIPAALGQEITAFSTGLPRNLLSPNPGLHLGRFDFHGGLTAGGAYDDLVQFSPAGQPEDDFTWTVSPYLSARTEGPNARSLGLTYQPAFVFYTDHSDLNSINHSGNVVLNWPLNRLTLSLQGNANSAPIIVRDIGNRAETTSFTAQGTADYDLSHLTFLEGIVGFSRYDYGGQYIGSQSYNQQLTVNYRFTPKLTLGAGVSVIEIDAQDEPLQTSEGPQVRLTYVPTPRLHLSASAGVQFQQFGTSQSEGVAPIFTLSGSYLIRQGTSLSVDAHRSEQPSGVFAGQNYSDTGITASISQVLPHRITATLGAGYTLADYYTTQPGVQTSRTDNYYYVNTDVNYALTDRWSLALYFQHTGNSSNGNTFTYDHNIVGLRAGWSF